MPNIQRIKKLAFPIMLVIGAAAFGVILVFEDRPYTGPTAEVIGKVAKSEYVHGGAASGRSFTRIHLEDGRTFRFPVGEKVAALNGDEIYMVVPADAATGATDIQVVRYELIRASHFD